jgi:hypothetical protein
MEDALSQDCSMLIKSRSGLSKCPPCRATAMLENGCNLCVCVCLCVYVQFEAEEKRQGGREEEK